MSTSTQDSTVSPPPQDPAVQSATIDWQNNVNETNYLYNTQLANQQQSMEKLLNTMGTVGASIAFNILIPILMLKVNGTNNTQMEIEASQSNEESDVLTLVNITQSDDNYLASESSTYLDNENTISTYQMNYDTWYINGQKGPPPTPPPQSTYDEVDTYNSTYFQAEEAQGSLQTMFDANSDPNNPDYGWCDQTYADNMLSAINSWQAATKNLSDGTTVSPYAYAMNMSSYASDPTNPTGGGDSTCGTDVTNLTTSLNTETSANGSVQSQLQGLEKTQIAIGQQYLSSSKSFGAGIIKEKDYWVQKQSSQ